MMETKTLYGKDKAGKYKVWCVWTEQDNLYIMHGQQNGKMQTKCEKIEGKNIGRSNETSPSEQAELEAMSRWRKQIDRGYRESKDELGDIPLLPMLASDYLKQGHRISYPCIISPKLDGVRCLAIRKEDSVELKSRGGKLYSVKHIQDQLLQVMKEGDIWDGELYLHGKYLEEIVSAVKKPNTVTPSIQFVIFDVVTDEEYEYRVIELQRLRRCVVDSYSHIKVLVFKECHHEEDMKLAHKEYVDQGFEGVMLRNFSGKYESGKRSADLQKYKQMLEEDFQITEVVADRNGNAVFKVWDRTAQAEFSVVGGDFESRQYALKHPEEFISKWANIAYQTRYKDSKLPQFPVIRTIREGALVNDEFIAGE